MQSPSTIAKTKHQAAMSSLMLWVVLNYFAVSDRLPDFSPAYHSLDPQHLPQCMWQKRYSLFGGDLNVLQGFAVFAHLCIL